MAEKRHRRLSLVLSAALGVTLVAGMAPAIGATAADTVPEAQSEAERALVQATETGKPVEVVGERSEFTTTYANPDGESFQLDQSAVPVRVKTDAGGWMAPDATLEVRPDGTIGPKAAVVDVSFSNGGAGTDLVELAEGERTLALGWPGNLPKPTLDGPNATYQEVLPGVDLRMTATVEGYREVLVVKTPQAAANPALKRIEFSLKSDGLAVAGSKEGGITATDSDGKAVFAAPPALMWDSSGDASTGDTAVAETQSRVKTAAFTTVSAVSSAAEDSPTETSGMAESSLDGPDQDDAKADVPVDVDHDSVTVVPDADMLATTEPSAFPIYIDPNFEESNEVERLLLRSDGYENYGWGNGDDNLGKGVGKCGSWNGEPCGPGYVQRLYFEFTPAFLRGKIALDATFRITEPWAFQCEPRNVWLVRTASEITKSTTWSTKPAYKDLLGDRWVSAGRGSACDPNSPAAPIEFNDNPDEPDENLTPTVQDFADGKFDRLTLELRAEDETDTSAWKRFRNDAVLSVKYTGRPGLPTGVAVREGGSGGDCAKDPGKPMVISETKPTFTALAQTAPGGETSAYLRVVMLVEKQNGDGSWTRVGDTGDRNWPQAPAYATDGKPVTHDSLDTLLNGPLYRYRAWVRSYTDATSSRYWGGPITPGCYFQVDTLKPKPPVVEFVSTYTECLEQDPTKEGDECAPHGGPGRGGDFKFKPASGDVNTAYRYRLNTDTKSDWSDPINGAAPEVRVVPNTSGLVTLYVQAFDGLAWGAQADVSFNVARRAAPVGHWNFGETSGPALDTDPLTTNPEKAVSDPDDAATLAGGASRPSDGRRGWLPKYDYEDRALKLDGTSAYAATQDRIISTQSSYSISVWVRPDRVDRTFSVLGQAGDYMSGVSISHHAGATWSVRLPTKDEPGADISTNVVMAKRPAVAGVWTHIMATYSASSNMLRFYINGEKQGETEVLHPVWAGGGMSFGRIKYQGNWVDYFPGLIDEVTVWQDLLTPEEIKAEAKLRDPDTDGAFAELVANWNPEGPTGSTLSDTSGYNRDLALSSGAALSGEYLNLNGTSGAGTLPAPALDDTGSFTATARVELDHDKLMSLPVNTKVHVMGQRTSAGSAWSIWYEKTGVVMGRDADLNEVPVDVKGKWHFGRLGSTSYTSASSNTIEGTSQLQVTGVFDAQEGEISLYLGDGIHERGQEFTAQAGNGTFAVGKGYVGGQWGGYLPGRIREARLWVGAFDDNQIGTRVIT
ncbi:LamG domain-containing protein [Streptomyces sp. NPDC086023]|uniref:LamG domain-containing protein n=1 Tax=Streptomyces sp. NPDC086023 TaxID=3365746 RepID=UPI0037D1B31C